MCFYKCVLEIEKSATLSDDEFLEEFIYDYPLLPEWMFEENNGPAEQFINPLDYSCEIDGSEFCACVGHLSDEDGMELDSSINYLMQLPHNFCEEHNCSFHTFGFDRDHILPPWFLDQLEFMTT